MSAPSGPTGPTGVAASAPGPTGPPAHPAPPAPHVGPPHPANKFIPPKAIIGEIVAPKPVPTPAPVKTLTCVDARNGKLRPVILIKGLGLTKNDDGRVIFVPGFPTSDFMSAAQSKSKFAVKADGTVVYDPSGFNPTPNPQYNLIDIAEVIAANN